MNAVEKNTLNAKNAVVGTTKNTIDGAIVKLEKVTSVNDGRRRNIDFDYSNFSTEHPYCILAAKVNIYGKVVWEIVAQIETLEDARFHFDNIVHGK